ncbi:hypothetical protein GQ602_007260 [Ophiocordyceps camponoti-floridani]|uniref:Uncharacterized protein n=1 Tax=Ophiocordyceps camponoti-floridani TaxID=2030778 RepID=A0A8H4Q0Y5_9HYPO|nr:hypothetical protein GQ602_007260 [Ophiocordyceps camponoti-floridani]
MSHDSKNMVSQTENDAPPVGKKRGCLNHTKRFWWAYGLALCALIVLVVCLLIFVAVPKIAQKKMDAAVLDIQGVAVRDTKPDGYRMDVNSTMETDGSMHADIDEFRADLVLTDVKDGLDPVFASLTFKKTPVEKLIKVNVSEEANITNRAGFTMFNTLMYQRESVRVIVRGETRIKPAGLNRKYSVKLFRNYVFKGLNRFQGATVDGLVDITALKGTPNFKGKAVIPNRSIFTLEIGNASFTNFADGQNLGTMTINNLVLRPGDNEVDVEAMLDQIKMLKIMTKRPYCETGIVPFDVLGTKVVNNGEELDYFTKALGSANQTIDIDIGKILRKSLPDLPVACA